MAQKKPASRSGAKKKKPDTAAKRAVEPGSRPKSPSGKYWQGLASF